MKNKILLFLCVLSLFAGCKKKRERIEPFIGIWSIVGYFNYDKRPAGKVINNFCTTKILKIKILRNNRFISYDSLDNVLCRGRIDFLNEGQGKIIIKHNFKEGNFKVTEYNGSKFCNVPDNSRILHFEALLDGGYPPKNSMFFDGTPISLYNTVFLKTNN